MNLNRGILGLLCTAILFASTCSSLRLGPRLGFPSSELDMERVYAIINDLASGAFAYTDLSVFFDDTVTRANEFDSLIKSFKKPLTLFSVRKNVSNEEYDVINENLVLFLLNISPESRIFSSPPPLLEARFVFALNFDPQIKPESFFESPLITKSRMATIISPFINRKTKDLMKIEEFIVYQDLGFNSNGTRSQKMSKWTPGSFRTFESLLVERWNSLGGTVLHISTNYEDKPFIFVSSKGEVTGISVKILDVFAERMHFSYTTQFGASDDEWGAFVNGSWNGMLGEVYRREKNMTINYLTITYQRTQDFDFSSPYYNEGFGFALKNPEPLPRWMSLTFPFSLPVWGGIAATVMILSFVYYVYRLLSGHKDTNLFFNTFILFLKPLFKQPANEMSLKTKFDIIFANTWWLISFVISISYSCNFIAFLTVAKFPPRVRLLNDLAESDYRVVMMDYGEFVPVALMTTTDRILQKLGSKLDLIPQIISDPNLNYGESYHMVMNSTHAHLETFSYLKYLYSTTFPVADKVYFMTEQIYSGNLAFFFPKRTPWKHKFDELIPRLVESGIIVKWYEDAIMEGVEKVVENREGGVSPLYLDHFQGAFYIFGICVVLSVIIFLGEMAFPPRNLNQPKSGER